MIVMEYKSFLFMFMLVTLVTVSKK
jgi:hypothetical protein